MKLLFVLLAVSLRLAGALPTHDDQRDDVDGEQSRKIIGQSVVTSVSVIMNGAGEEPHFTDAVGKTVPRPFVPPQVASPINLLNPDRYEFYTFNDMGDLVKRLMTLKEIQSIVANGNGATLGDNEPESQSVLLNSIPLSNQGAETKVQDIVDNVQQVLSREMENNKNSSQIPAELLDTPDVSSSWSMILPAIFGNTGGEILPHKPINMTPETEVFDTTTTRAVPTRKVTTRYPTSTATRAPTITVTKASDKTTTATKVTQKTTQKFSPTPTKAASTSTKKQTFKVRPKPSTSARTTTAIPTTIQMTTQEEILRTTYPDTFMTFEVTQETQKATTPTTTRVKVTPTKKIVKKPTPAYKRPYTNSPIIIEKIPKRPLHVESKTDRIEIERKTTAKPATTLALKPETSSLAPVTIAPSTTVETTEAVKTEAPSTTTTQHQTTSQQPKVTSTTSRTETTQVMLDKTTLSTSEEDRQDSAINQIIGSLQSDLFKTSFEVIPTTNRPIDESTETEKDLAMEKIGDLNLVPDKVLLNDQLFIEESEPIVTNLPTTTATPDEITTVDTPVFEKLAATTTKTTGALSENSEVMQTIEKLIAEQTGDKKAKPEKLDILGFDDDDETEIKLKGTLESKKNMTHSEYITKAATVASFLSAKFSEPTTTETSLAEEIETTVPTILSEALSNVIQLMIEEQEAKKTTQRPSDEPSEFDLNQLLQHYEDLNIYRDKLESLSLLSDKASTTTQKIEAPTTVRSTSENVSVETTVVRETSSVSMKKGESAQETKTEATTEEPERFLTTTDANEEFSTFFYVGNEETTMDPSNDGLGDFTTEQFVVTEKKLSERKEESFTTRQPESYEETGDLVSGILEAIGIASDEEDETSSERMETTTDSQESDEVENVISSLSSSIGKTTSVVEKDLTLTGKLASGAISSLTSTIDKAITPVVEKDLSLTSKLASGAISSLTSTIDKTLTTDVKSDLSLTSEIASGLLSVADTISDTLNVGMEDSEEEATTVLPVMRLEPTTQKTSVTVGVSKATKKAVTKKVTTTEMSTKDVMTTEAATESSVPTESTESQKNVSTADSTESQTQAETEKTSLEVEAKVDPESPKEKAGTSPMLQLSIIRKDNSLEEIEYITPPTATTKLSSSTEANFIKIENIETTSITKPSDFKSKVQQVHDHIKPLYIAVRSTTAKSSSLPEATPSQPTLHKLEEVATERVPLIEITQTTEIPSSSEDNLVEIKVQTKPTTAVPTTTETHQSTLSQLQPNAQTIKNIIKISQQQMRPQLPPVELSIAPKESLGLAASTAHLNGDLREFSKLCNDLAFSFWKSITADGISQSRSVIISPFALTSTLSMIFLGARGQTSGEMNDLLRLDDMVSFNPHVVFRNISESIEQSRDSGIAAAAFVRELYSDRSKGKLLPYFKEKAQQFYGAHVEEVNFDVINDILRRRTNLLVKRHTFSKINEYLKTNNIWVNEPLAAVSANVFLTNCKGATTSERDGEMFFQVSPAIRQRRLIPIPAAVYRSGFTAGYDPILDATAVAFGDDLQSTIMVMPGQQGTSVPGDNLERLEDAFMDPMNDVWGRLLTTFMERPGLEVQIPRFSHRSLINTTFALQQMGLKEIFDSNKADLRGLTGAKSNDLFFSDLMQINQFSTCGEDKIADAHHIEIYPSPSLKRHLDEDDAEEDGKLEISSPEKSQNLQSMFYDPIYDSRYMNVPLPLRPRQARLPDNPRLRFDRPFLYFVRHNPTGIILFMGRFNPRLLP